MTIRVEVRPVGTIPLHSVVLILESREIPIAEGIVSRGHASRIAIDLRRSLDGYHYCRDCGPEADADGNPALALCVRCALRESIDTTAEEVPDAAQ